MILRCSRCGNMVTDSYAQYSPKRNQFWCKNCTSEADAEAFHSLQCCLYTPSQKMWPSRGLSYFEYRPCQKGNPRNLSTSLFR